MKQHVTSPYWALRARADPGNDIEARAALFASRMPDRAFFFGRTAAALHGLPLPPRFRDETLLHIGVMAGARRVDALGIVPHHVAIDERDITQHRGLPVTSAARTWCDLGAGGLTLGQLVAAGDRIIWRRSAQATTTELRAALSRYSSRRGVRLLRTGIELLSDRSDSAPESELRIATIEAGFPHPEINVPVRVGDAEITPDLSWPSARVAIEYEGDHHRTEADQWHRDIRRQTGLHRLGWSTYRATADDYRDPHFLLLWLARHLPEDR